MAQVPGWYEDGTGSLRWWDGGAWTEHVRPLPDAAGGTSATSSPVTPPPSVPLGGQPLGADPFGQQPLGGQQPGFAPGFPPQPAFAGADPFAGPAAAQRKSSTRKVLIIVGSVLAVLALVAVGLVLLFRTLITGPQQAVGAYNDAYLAGDCTALQRTVETDFFTVVFGDCATFEADSSSLVDALEGGADGFSYSITSTDRVNSEATVVVRETFRWNDGTEQVDVVTYSLSEVDGVWRIWDTVYED